MILLVLLISFGSTSCFNLPGLQKQTGNTTTSDQQTIPTTTGKVIQQPVVTSGKVVVHPNFSKKHALNEKFLSFNTGFMFTAPIEKEDAVSTINQTLRPHTLRFPGGTLGNYYHVEGLGYGLQEKDIRGQFSEVTRAMPLFKQNAIYHFAEMCKTSNINVVYVANMMTAEVDETIWAIEYFISQNIPIVGIELGNEFYLNQYRSIFSDPTIYVNKAKEFAKVLKKKFPQIPLGIVAASPTEARPKSSEGKFKYHWNQVVGKENFYDFYIPHLYPKVKGCAEFGGDDLNKVHECLNLTISTEHLNYHQIIVDYYKQFFGNKKMWITEWNSQAENNISNTIRHAEFVGEFLMGLIDISIKHPQLEYAYFHNYGSGGFVSPIFTYTNRNNTPYFKKEGKIAYNATYFPFLFYRHLLDNKVKRIQESVQYPNKLSNQNIVFKTFVSENNQELYLFFINKTANKVPFEVKGVKKILKTEGVQGQYPWSVAGYNGLYKILPKIDLIQYIPTDYQEFLVPPNSIGYFVISMS